MEVARAEAPCTSDWFFGCLWGLPRPAGPVSAPAVWLFSRQRAWWLWLRGRHGQETNALRWTWRVGGVFGLGKALDQTEILSWRANPPPPQQYRTPKPRPLFADYDALTCVVAEIGL
jgi:hypothetical protein